MTRFRIFLFVVVCLALAGMFGVVLPMLFSMDSDAAVWLAVAITAGMIFLGFDLIAGFLGLKTKKGPSDEEVENHKCSRECIRNGCMLAGPGRPRRN